MFLWVSPPPGVKAFNVTVESLAELEHAITERLGLDYGEVVVNGPGGKVLSRGVVSQGSSLVDLGLQPGSTIRVGLPLKGGGPKKKGGKGGRGAVPELDERQRKLLEIEEAKKASRAAKKELKQRLEVEKRNSSMNRLKIQNQWRKIMRLAKVEMLRKDIEILSQNHERDLDRKDAIIQMLDRDLEESEEQFQMALRSHLEQIDKLVDFHDGRLLSLEQEFERDLASLEKEFKSEKDFLSHQHGEQVKELTGIIGTIDGHEAEKEAEARQEHEQLREEIRNKSLDAINVLRITLDSQIEDLEQHFETAHLNYLQNTDTRTTDFKNLTSKDQELSKEIEVKVRKIERLSANIKHWRLKIGQSSRENNERNQLLLAEKQSIQGHFQKLKNRMNKFREQQQRKLLDLTQNANAAREVLTTQTDLSSHILSLAELARKKETEQEKVLSFYTSSVQEEFERELAEMMREQQEKSKKSSLPDDGAEHEQSPLQSSATNPSTGRSIEHWNHLENFYKKYNKALLDKLFLDRERERLEKENAALQAIVKQYLNGITVNDEVMKNVNPLLVINGRVNVNKSLPVRAFGRPDDDHEPAAVIDANHMVQTNRINSTPIC